MTKYKLIKEYPGSPKLGHIICCNDFTHNGVDRHSCSDYPEFWEEVVEKDYEIISFKQNIGVTDLWTKFGSNNWCRNYNGTPITNPYTYDEIINSKLYKINSVKRLSDGEIFTIGDKIHFSDRYKDFIIESIILNAAENRIRFHGEGLFATLNVSPIVKVKQPLFTTEDGVDIYDGDTYISVIKNYNSSHGIGIAKEKNRNNYRQDLFYFFSSEEKAQDHIIMNKSCLSINDIIKHTNFNFHTVIDELKTKVKSKLI